MEWKVPLSDIDIGQDRRDAVVKVPRSKWLTIASLLLIDSLKKLTLNLMLFCLLLSYIVLQHILSDNELLRMLTLISNKCKENTIFIAPELIESDRFNIRYSCWGSNLFTNALFIPRI